MSGNVVTPQDVQPEQVEASQRGNDPSAFKFRSLLEETITEWSNDNVPRLGAALAFYTLLSLAPLLVVSVAVAGLAFGQKAAQGQLIWQLQGVVGIERARTLQDLLQSAYKPGAGIVATILSLLILAFGASAVLIELRDALNTIWHVASGPSRSRFATIMDMVKQRLYYVGLVIGVGVLLLASLVLNASVAAIGKFFGSFLPSSQLTVQLTAALVSFAVIAFLFAAIYKIIPDVPLRWGDVVVGAIATAFLFEAGKQLIALYLAKTTLGSMYGAAGSMVMLFVWVYYSAQLFFLGAEFTKAYTKFRISTGARPRTGFFHLGRLKPTRPA